MTNFSTTLLCYFAYLFSKLKYQNPDSDANPVHLEATISKH